MDDAREGAVQAANEAGAASSWLDRPLIPSLRISHGTMLYVLLILFVVLTRLWDLSSRSYSHDESIHAWESWKLYTGQGYTHSPVYHGPLLYHVTAGIYALFGDSDTTARLGTALGGIAIVVLPLFLRRWLGTKGLLATTLLMAVSPVLMHRSRFIRHDHFAIVANMLLLIAILHYLERPKPKLLYLAAAALMLGFAAKETSFITYAIYGVFLAGLLGWQWLHSQDRTLASLRGLPVFDLVILIGTLILPFAAPFPILLLGGDPLDSSSQGMLFSLGITLVMFGIGAGIGLWWNAHRWLVCAAIYWGIFFPLFTTMFTNGAGVATGVVGQLGYWLSQHEFARGGQPWHYYLVLTGMYEFLPALLAPAGIVAYALGADTHPAGSASAERPRAPFLPFVIFWTCLALALYSWAGEKMPWLMMHIVVPMHLLGGWTLGRLLDADWRAIRERGGLWLLPLVPLLLYLVWRVAKLQLSTGTTTAELSESVAWLSAAVMGIGVAGAIGWLLSRLRRGDAWRMVGLALVSLLLALTLRTAWMVTFRNADSAAELLVYAQGAPDVGIVAREIEDLSRRLTGGLHLKIAYDSEVSWPFVWYLRNYDNAVYFGDSPGGPLDADVVLVGLKNEDAVKPFLGDAYIRREHRLIWWPYQDWYQGMLAPAFWEKLAKPEGRRALWDVWFYRKWDRPLTDWPYVAKFALYVRRDVAQWLWQGGPEALALEGGSAGESYLDKWAPRTAVAAWGTVGQGAGQFQQPKGLAVDAEGRVYVADSQNHRIQVLDAQGAPLAQWGAQGGQPGQFQEPWDVAVSPEGEVYVADTWNHRIQIFDRQGAYLGGWGTFGEVGEDLWRDGVFYGPRALAFDDEANLYIADTGNKRVLKYDPEGQLVAVVGGAGQEQGRLNEPVGLAVGPDGAVYVADTWNRRIQVFDSELRFLREWTVQAWEGASVVNKPYLAVDAEGNVWATDPEGYRILRFDAQGELLGAFGRYGTGLDGMNLPTGIAIDAQGRLLVSDSENHRILVFELASSVG